jgi:glycosyltransferase involved in cell wall biosynthesis
MARVAFFTESLTDSLIGQLSWEIVQTLCEQNHEVKVITSSDQNLDGLPTHRNLHIVQPFRRWSWLESIPVVPMLLEFRPDILHFAQPRGVRLQGWVNGMNILGATHAMLGRPLVVTSLFDVTDHQSWRRSLAMVLQQSDFITVTNRVQQQIISRWFVHQPYKVQLWPISRWGLRPLALASTLPTEIPFTDWAFIPGPVSDHLSSRKLQDTLIELLRAAPTWGAVIGGGWGAVPPSERKAMMAELHRAGVAERVLWTGELSATQLSHYLQQCRAVVLVSVEHSSLIFANHLRVAISQRKPILISYLQKVAVDVAPASEPLLHLALNLTRHELRRAFQQLLSAIDTVVSSTLPVERDTLDESGNFLSRLYVDGLEQKRNHT